MKKLVQINVVCNGSTGKIMCDIAKMANDNGYETFCFFGRGEPNKNVNCIKIGNKLSIYFHVLLARLGFNGYGSYFSTKILVRKLKKINPDIIHLHNIHGYYINLKVLFKYLKNEYSGKIIWTLHDCWAFTGHCSHFTAIKCSKWKNECYKCPQLNAYPKEYFDTTNREYKLKRRLFSGLTNLTIVTPSNWLKALVNSSFLRQYRVEVINNGIDLSIFKPTYDDAIYDKYNIPKDKKIILGVANVWNDNKGLQTFTKLSEIISNDMIIVLVGLNDKQVSNLPNNIIGVKKTNNIFDLVKIYTIADVFVNPSLEETFSLVTVEAMACGTPVIVSGSSATKELVLKDRGIVVKNNTFQEYYKSIKKMLDCSANDLRIKNKFYESSEMVNLYLSSYKG